MTTFDDAHNKVQQMLSRLAEQMNIELALDERATRIESWCWVFFYNSRAYLETGSFSHALAGNGPIVVERSTGAVHQLTTARPVEEQLDELRRAVSEGGV